MLIHGQPQTLVLRPNCTKPKCQQRAAQIRQVPGMPRPSHSWGTRRWLPLAGRWDTHPPHSAALPPWEEVKDGNMQLHPTQHISGFLLPFTQTVRGARDGLTAGNGSLCVLLAGVTVQHPVRMQWQKSFSRTPTSGTPFNFVQLGNLELGYFYCLNKEHKIDGSLESSVRTSLGTEGNISLCSHWIKQGEISTLSYLKPSPTSRTTPNFSLQSQP